MTQSNGHIFQGKVFVVGDNIDTDQIIPARHLSLVPTIPEEYAQLGAQALSGLPNGPRYVAEGALRTEYPIVVAGRNFGCGSSREHAPIALGAAGCRVVVADSFARIFFRNCIATGEVYPIERREPVHDLKTGDSATIRLDQNVLILSNGRQIRLAPLGDALPVIDAGGLFAYSRQSGLLG